MLRIGNPDLKVQSMAILPHRHYRHGGTGSIAGVSALTAMRSSVARWCTRRLMGKMQQQGVGSIG